VQLDLAGAVPGRHGGAVDQSGRYPAASSDKLRHADGRELPQPPSRGDFSRAVQAIGKLLSSLYND